MNRTGFKMIGFEAERVSLPDVVESGLQFEISGKSNPSGFHSKLHAMVQRIQDWHRKLRRPEVHSQWKSL